MLARIVILASAVFVTACGSNPPRAHNEQYCDIKTETVSVKDKNGRVVDERTVEVLKCNDNKVERLFLAQSGISKECGEYKYFIPLNGQVRERLGYACQKYDGTWEVVPHPSNFR
jgi:hypothetical protein